MAKKKKTPWPTKDVMHQIYDKHFWGGNDFDFYSGTGSHNPDIIQPYLSVVSDFLNAFTTPLIVCDLGCGDFNIGKRLMPYASKYIAIDIVEPLISRNKTLFNAENLEFHCLDIAQDKLPAGDCIILRQVLQHLSNTEIHQILEKLQHYKYIILTEHIPIVDFEPNKDIISGQGIRLKQHSGVDILKAPFNFKVKDHRTLNHFSLGDSKGQIVTTLYTVF